MTCPHCQHAAHLPEPCREYVPTWEGDYQVDVLCDCAALRRDKPDAGLG